MSETVRDLFAGPPVEVPLPRSCTFSGGAHPHADVGWCSCCHEPAAQGVTIRKAGEPGTFVFFCRWCIHNLAVACP